ncbi:NFX1-type zinc finger-containing protein 1 [Eumeta japonica]|uniref:NFX1-type zinc finger-containing protein 1 n=1 Tax=Eumeta variegata TaxID=151549 RepID=A0A4C1UY54_EUMVA|nr:NFX1-type zinc finger-containing protein 1 [Eumeta japonica]
MMVQALVEVTIPLQGQMEIPEAQTIFPGKDIQLEILLVAKCITSHLLKAENMKKNLSWPLIDLAMTLCLPFLSEKHNLKLPEEHTQRFQTMKEKFSAQEKQTKGTNHKNHGHAPDDFRTLSLFPGTEDLLKNRPFVRPNIIDGSYESVEHYLDVQFRLLQRTAMDL